MHASSSGGGSTGGGSTGGGNGGGGGNGSGANDGREGIGNRAAAWWRCWGASSFSDSEYVDMYVYSESARSDCSTTEVSLLASAPDGLDCSTSVESDSLPYSEEETLTAWSLPSNTLLSSLISGRCCEWTAGMLSLLSFAHGASVGLLFRCNTRISFWTFGDSPRPRILVFLSSSDDGLQDAAPGASVNRALAPLPPLPLSPLPPLPLPPSKLSTF